MVNCGSQGSSLECVQSTFWMGNPVKLTPYPTENVGYTSTFKQKKKKENFSQTRKYKNKTKNKKKKNKPSQTWLLYSRKNRPVVPIIWPVLHRQFLIAYSRDVENIYIHCLLLLQHFTCEQKEKLLFKLYLNPINRYCGKLNS